MTLDAVIRLAVVVTESLCVLLIFRKRAYRLFPVFCAYLIWDLIDNFSLFGLSSFYPAVFFQAYVIALAVDSLFVFAVLVELAWSVLRPFRSALPRGAVVIIALGIGAVCAGIWPFAHSAAYSHYRPDARFMIHLQQTIAIMRILFFLVLAGCSQLLSINWRDREMQIATGLGFYSLVSVAVSVIEAGLPASPLYHHLDQTADVAYLFTIIYWIFSFAKEEAPRREFTPQMQSFLLAVAGAARSTRVSLADARTEKGQHHDER